MLAIISTLLTQSPIQVCDATKQAYQSQACCGSDPDLDSVCMSKTLNVDRLVGNKIDLGVIDETSKNTVKRMIASKMELETDEKLMGGLVMAVTEDGNSVLVGEGTTLNSLGQPVNNTDKTIMRNIASSSKNLLTLLVYRMIYEGIFFLHTSVEDMIPEFSVASGNIPILRDIKTEEDGSLTVINATGGRTVVFSNGVPNIAAKGELEKLSRPITVAHLLTHTAGVASSTFATELTALTIASGFQYNLATSAAESVLGLPSTLGVVIDQPGTNSYYDGSHEFLNGFIEVVYNKIVNKIPATPGMSDHANFENLEDIFEKLVAVPLGCTREDFVFGTTGDAIKAAKISPLVNHNDVWYTVTTAGNAVSELTDPTKGNMTMSEALTAKVLPLGVYSKTLPHKVIQVVNPYRPGFTGKTYYDLSGRFTCVTLTLLERAAQVWLSKGKYNGATFVTQEVIDFSLTAQVPPSVTPNPVTSNGKPLGTPFSVIFGAGSIMYRPYSWLTGPGAQKNPLLSSMSTWIDRGANGATFSIKFAGVVYISSINNFPFYIRLADAPDFARKGALQRTDQYMFNDELSQTLGRNIAYSNPVFEDFTLYASAGYPKS